MPKLNVQQSNQNVIQAFRNALAIGNLKGIIASDGNHNFSTAGSNRNLLDNPWFTVNQRGVNGTITNGQYGLDRWMAGGGTVTMATGEITLGAGNSYAMQRPAAPSIFNGKTVTLSVMTSDGTVESGTVVAQTGSAKTVRTANFELCIGYTAYNSFYFYNTSSSAKTVIATKLELGSVSTLANDVPPDYWQELDKCLYYFERITNNGSSPLTIGAGFADGVNNLYVPVRMHRKRAGIATVSYSGTIYAGQRSSNIVVSSMTQYNSSPDGIITLLAVTPSSFTNNEYYRLALGAGAHIDFSPDL